MAIFGKDKDNEKEINADKVEEKTEAKKSESKKEKALAAKKINGGNVCGKCKHCQDTNSETAGKCRRYPQPFKTPLVVNKVIGYCGEFE